MKVCLNQHVPYATTTGINLEKGAVFTAVRSSLSPSLSFEQKNGEFTAALYDDNGREYGLVHSSYFNEVSEVSSDAQIKEAVGPYDVYLSNMPTFWAEGSRKVLASSSGQKIFEWFDEQPKTSEVVYVCHAGTFDVFRIYTLLP